MSTTVNLGKVVGDGALVNEVEDLTLQASANSGVNYTQSGDNATVEMDTTNKVQSKLSGAPGQLVGFDVNGNATPVPIYNQVEHYGFELFMDETYGPNMIRYIEQNTGYKHAGMNYTTGKFDYGDWEDAWFIKDIKPCMLNYDGTVAYELDKNDYSKKADGTASDIGDESFPGNVMIGIPTVWIRVDTSVSRKPKFYFANARIDSRYNAYAHMDDKGNVVPYVYMPAYNGWVDSDGRLRSISGKAPTGLQNGTVQVTEARGNNVNGATEWDIEKFVDRQLINLLLLLIGKSTDTQTVFGYGNGKGYSNPATGAGSYGVLNTGTMNTAGLFTGADDDPGNTGVKVFGIEHWWGNLWRRYIGAILSNGSIYYKLTKDTSDGSSVNEFAASALKSDTGTPTGWKHDLGGIDGTAGGTLEMYVGDFGLIGKTMGGDYDSKFYDRFVSRIGYPDNRPVQFGHAADGNTKCGAFACSFNDVEATEVWFSSAAPSCKPNREDVNDGVYGFQLDMDETYGSDMIKYIGCNKDYTPAHMDYENEVFDYGDWEDAFFIRNLRPCMLNYDGTVAYDLDKDDYTKKADGTASDVANANFGGNAMVGIPTVWVKVDTALPRKPKFYFADHQVDSSYRAYAHHDDNGNIMPYTYMPIYNGYKDSSNRLRSISGVSPTGSLTGTNQINYARNNNPSGSGIWDIEKFVDHQLINLLLLLIGKSTDTQTVFGYGNGNGGSNPASGADSNGILNSGTLNDKGMFYGYSSNPGNLGVKVFGIENWWGNMWRRKMGLVLSEGTYYYKLTKGTEDGSTVSGFNAASIADSAGTPTGWIQGGTISGGISSSDYWYGVPEDMYVGEFGLLDKTYDTEDDKTKNFCDRSYRRITQNRVALYGSGSNDGLTCGAFSCRLHCVLSFSPWYINASPSCKPNVTSI